ncbi:MAG: prolyl oligopeptidase family serine peptidase [Chitinophagales bacterium]|nr:prolyl oligopeptidase family serine peptidase [Chitinophagales bacterium]
MQKFFFLALLAAFFTACQPNNTTDTEAQNNEPMKLDYPTTEKGEVVDEYHGQTVDDPYRWLEIDTAENVKEWVKAENEVTFGYLEQIPFREAIRQRLEKLLNYERYSAPFQEGKYTYFSKNDGLQDQSVIYRQENADDEPKVFLDPNKFSKDGTTSLAGLSFTKDGSRAAYMISEGGSDWRKVIVIDAESMAVVDDTLKDVKFSGIAWNGNDGFYYSSYDKPKEGSQLSGLTQHHKLYYHKLGTPQSSDQLVFGGEETPRRYIFAGVTEDERWLAISAAVSTTGNELYLKDLTNANSPIVKVVDNFDNSHGIVHSEDGWLYIETNLDAPNNRLVKVKADNPSPENWTDVIPETKEVLSVSTAGGYLFAQYLRDALSAVDQYKLDGSKVRTVELPGQGTAAGFGGKWTDKELYYTFTSYIDPGTIYLYNIESGASEVYKKSGVEFDPSQYVSKQVFYESKDGTRVPMMITHKKGLELNGENPTMLYGYGGFNVSLRPYFSTSNIVWLENGGVYAVPNLRGGGEYGEEWHLAGTKTSKQNVFDDFIAAAEYLIENKYTSSDYLAISGGSNGGLLVGAVMTQRPDLVKVALPAVGVLDMLRYHKFTAGAGWAYDYGTADESPEMFEYLLGYSPYHNIKEGVSYPATMVTTADHDDRVVPAHSFKFAARLQEHQSSDNPTIIRIETKAGHGAGKPISMIIEEQADKWAFTLYNMNAPVKYLKN